MPCIRAECCCYSLVIMLYRHFGSALLAVGISAVFRDGCLALVAFLYDQLWSVRCDYTK